MEDTAGYRVDWTMPFYLRDLIICGFWYLSGVLELIAYVYGRPTTWSLTLQRLNFGWRCKTYKQDKTTTHLQPFVSFQCIFTCWQLKNSLAQISIPLWITGENTNWGRRKNLTTIRAPSWGGNTMPLLWHEIEQLHTFLK